MDELNIQNLIKNAILDWKENYKFEDAILSLNNNNLLLKMNDGAEFQITITQTKRIE